MSDSHRSSEQQSRRSFLKAATYVAPAILTLKATPSYAQLGSGRATEQGWRSDGGGGVFDMSLQWSKLKDLGH